DAQGYYEAAGLAVEFLSGGPGVAPQTVGSSVGGPEFTIAWVPKVLAARAGTPVSDLVDIAQVFQRSGTLSVSWADADITTPAAFADKTVGVWGDGDDLEILAAARKAGLEPGTDFETVIQPADMRLFLSKQVDVAQAMVYNEYAQVLEATDPATGELYQPTDLNVITYNDEGTAMLQDAVFARASWLADPGNEDVATAFLKASFQGWIHCRDQPSDCVEYTVGAGTALGVGHQTWMLNEVGPLIWPSPDGIGMMDPKRWQQTVDVLLEAGILAAAPTADAYRTDLAEAALAALADADTTGASYTKGTVDITPGGS
ncbi:MAG TPA: ABC transporter substrate-binding protein, partial [Candidatus Limnocylindrales bacterium]